MDLEESGLEKEEDFGGVWTSPINAGRPSGKIQLKSGYSHYTAGDCIAVLFFCCTVSRSLFRVAVIKGWEPVPRTITPGSVLSVH
jgi:hypothetical protein